MKRAMYLILAFIMCMSFAACGGKDEVQNIVVDGQETSVKDFLVENLNKYIQSDSYIQSQQRFQDIIGQEPDALKVTRVIELELAGEVTNSVDIHFLAVKADYHWAAENGDIFDSGVLIVDYDTGIVYDQSMVQESWFENQGTKEAWIYVLFNCSLVSADYDGGILITDAETRRELSDTDMAAINKALAQ